MRAIDSRFVTGLSNIPFAGVYVWTFPPGSFTGWDSEGVNNNYLAWLCLVLIVWYVELRGQLFIFIFIFSCVLGDFRRNSDCAIRPEVTMCG